MDSLLNLLSALVAFSAVMLVLSLLVTGLVQFAVSVFNVRYRAFQRGVEWYADEIVQICRSVGLSFQTAKSDLLGFAGAMPSLATSRQVGRALGADQATGLRRHAGRMARALRPAGVIATLKEEHVQQLVERAVTPVGEALTPAKLARLREQLHNSFSMFEAISSSIFVGYTRIWTAAAAVAVTLVFQISAPALFTDLMHDPKLREAAVQKALAFQAPSGDAEDPFHSIATLALAELRQRPWALTVDLSKVVPPQPATLPALRQAVLSATVKLGPQAPAAAEVQSAVNDAWARAAGQLAEQKAAEIGIYLESLSTLNIEPLRGGAAYYARPLTWIGMAMTVVMLMFGAPFWFERLKDIAALRDQLAAIAKPRPRA